MEWLIKLLGGITSEEYKSAINEHTQLQLNVEDTRKMTVSQLAAAESEKNELRSELKNTKSVADALAEKQRAAIVMGDAAVLELKKRLQQMEGVHAASQQQVLDLSSHIEQLTKDHAQSLKKTLADADEAVRVVKGCTKKVEDEAALAKGALAVKLNNAENLLAQATQKISEGLVQQAEQNAVLAASEQAVSLLRDEKSNLTKLLEERETELADYSNKVLDLYETIKTLESALSAAKAEVLRAKEEKAPIPNVEAIRTEAYEKAVAELKAIANKGNQTVDSVSRQRDAAVADRNTSREALRIATLERDAAIRQLEETRGSLSDVIKNVTRDRDSASTQLESLKQQLRVRGIDLLAIPPNVPSAMSISPATPASVVSTAAPTPAPILAKKSDTPSEKPKRDRSKKSSATKTEKLSKDTDTGGTEDKAPGKPVEDWIQNLLVEVSPEVAAQVLTTASSKTSKASKTSTAKKSSSSKKSAAPVADNDLGDTGAPDSAGTAPVAKASPARSHKKKGT